MNVAHIYQECLCPRNLQEHMMRVSAVAKIVINNWHGNPIDSNAIIEACLFHDIAKPMNFDLAKQEQFGMSLTEIDNLARFQNHIRTQFSDNEHEATVKICQAIGLGKRAVSIVKDLEWSYIPRLVKSNQIEPLIAIYSDMRIGPKGILSLQERLNDLKSRAQEDFEAYAKNGRDLEKLLSSNTTVDLNTINDQQINALFDEFLKSEVGNS